MASPVADSYSGPSAGIIAGGRFVAPDWAPAAGEIKTISKPAGFFGTNGGATLAEISPINYPWHPAYGTGTSYSLPFGIPASAGWASIDDYCGAFFNPDTRQYGGYGAGHSCLNACAPFVFTLGDLQWSWLDIPLPFDGYSAVTDWDHLRDVVPTIYGDAIDIDWGDINGSSAFWGDASRPGIIQPIPGHSRGCHVCIPGSKYGNASGVFFKSDLPTGKTNNAGTQTTYPSSHFFDFGTKKWTRANNKRPIAGGSGGLAMAYDPVSNSVIGFGAGGTASNAFGVFSVPSRSWTLRNSTNSKPTAGDHGSNVVHEAGRLYLMPSARTAEGASAGTSNGVTFEFLAVKIDDLIGTVPFAISSLTVNVVSTWPLSASGWNGYLGWSYCPADKCLYCTAPDGGSNKYWKLSPPVGAVAPNDYLTGAWTLTEHAFTTGTWINTAGTTYQYNRNQWDAKSRSFIWHSGKLNDPVMAWRPEGT